MTSTQLLDHLILFVPANPDTKLPELPPFFKNNFTITPGGFHADGATSNVLILLADGCYIEVISFIDDGKVAQHWWGPEATFIGWKDWCLTNLKSPEENHGNVGETHIEPIHGGRKRPDGIDVKWAVTFPKGKNGGQDVRGQIPFFCHDITERNVRVPLSAEKTSHACGALGVHQLTVIVKNQALLDQTRGAYKSILGGVETEGQSKNFQIGRVCEVKGLEGGASIILRLPKNDEEIEATKKTGCWYGGIVLAAKTDSEGLRGTRTRLDGSEDDVGGIWVEYV
ncbi:glyoxalase-like domain-containing protein [Phaeosphaeriaceae sp. PMI808]|nr:glyoxalase-like domain-containing protein [Phaeosphaeriaceae sp. PMI808]